MIVFLAIRKNRWIKWSKHEGGTITILRYTKRGESRGVFCCSLAKSICWDICCQGYATLTCTSNKSEKGSLRGRLKIGVPRAKGLMATPVVILNTSANVANPIRRLIKFPLLFKRTNDQRMEGGIIEMTSRYFIINLICFCSCAQIGIIGYAYVNAPLGTIFDHFIRRTFQNSTVFFTENYP